jgi:hypothetical protein
MEAVEPQEPNLKRKFLELVCSVFSFATLTTEVDESVRVENELSQLKKQKLEWQAEREYIINRLAAATQTLEQHSAEEKKSAGQVW